MRFYWPGAATCGGCGKRCYPDRRTAKGALRAIFPGQTGTSMNVYRCRDGGSGYHIGHRRVERSGPEWPEWFDAEDEYRCGRCPALIVAGEPAAWLDQPGVVVCFDCADLVEQACLRAAS